MTSKLNGDEELNGKIQEWMEWDKNEKTRDEIQTLVKEGNVDNLRTRLFHRMEFGTAGLRARMGAGYNMMCDLTIIQTTQGFAKYMLEVTPDIREHGVVVGYDARHNSQRFAWLTSTILLHLNIPVYLFSQICPTPYVPYGVLKYKCCWGIMVTASHNPKEDNGYKVYYRNGAQIIPPHDNGIASSIKQNLAPWSSSWDVNVVDSNPLRRDPFDEISHDYMHDVKHLCCHRELNRKPSIKFTYTAMHGVGHQFVQQSFKAFGFEQPIPVKEQVEPDPEFPTVKFPNPEEGKSALDLSMSTADANGSTVILANDPDADRLAIAEKLPSGQWNVFSGNEIGALLGWWLWQCHQNNSQVPASEVYCLSSTVSSKILQSMAKIEGFNFMETLTGFKWMGNYSDDLMKKGKTVLFAFEEAIGFMCGSRVLDKDGVSAAAVAAEMATWLAERGSTLYQQLQDIYTKYGHHVSSNSYYICNDPATINAMFERIRNYHDTGKYPEYCGEYKIKYIRDLTTGYDNSQPDNKAILPVSTSSHMITFTFDNGCVATIRTSGTEPKIKYYTEFCSDPSKQQDRETIQAELAKMVDAIVNNFYEPERNQLVARSG